MADLTDLQAAGATKIVGSDSSGLETNAVNADVNGNLLTKDFATSPTGSTVPSNATQVAGKNTAGNLQTLSIDRDGKVNTNNGTDKSVFGPLVVASRVQQLAVDF